MKITAKEEYGLRCILRVAHAGLEKSVAAPEVAEAEGISVAYANKLMNILKRSGLLKSVRGNKGGYQLSRAPHQITLSDILKALGSAIFMPDFCKSFPGRREECVHYRASCSARSVWTVLTERIEEVLSHTTLADLLDKNELHMSNFMRLQFGEQTARLREVR